MLLEVTISSLRKIEQCGAFLVRILNAIFHIDTGFIYASVYCLSDLGFVMAGILVIGKTVASSTEYPAFQLLAKLAHHR